MERGSDNSAAVEGGVDSRSATLEVVVAFCSLRAWMAGVEEGSSAYQRQRAFWMPVL